MLIPILQYKKKGFFSIAVLLLLSATGWAQRDVVHQINIIPQPASIKAGQGSFPLNNNTALFLSTDLDNQTSSLLTKTLRNHIGFSLPLTKTSQAKKAISLFLNKTKEQESCKEGYTLVVDHNGISIRANYANGLFYGIQTLLQLLPPYPREGKLINNASKINIPFVEITDDPRFEWRGVMLDVSRHFFSKNFIKSLIDQMAFYKFNTFHWHLTDDNGWRIQIEGLPRLTDIGAWRVPRVGGRFGDYSYPRPDENPTYGGFYTQDEIREIVSYAAERYITIVPEIDIPGHSKALIASYPNLGCLQGLTHYVNPGSWLGNLHNVLCAANDSTYLILDKIFTQVAGLFPGQYIHLGGDEVDEDFWAKDPKCRKLMEENGLENTGGLLGYFFNKAVKIIESKGKKAIGWEEIIHGTGGLTPGTVLQSWTGVEAGIKASAMGSRVIMSPMNRSLYMTNDYGAIKRAYSFDPVPAGADPNFILGAEGCLWTENVPHQREAEKILWPHLMALSEVFWSEKRNMHYDQFTTRLEAHLPKLKDRNINYSKKIYDPKVIVSKNMYRFARVQITTELNGLDVYYTFDGTDPDEYSPKYNGGFLEAPLGATDIKVVTFRNGKQMGKIIEERL
jgi:hexosaminidase